MRKPPASASRLDEGWASSSSPTREHVFRRRPSLSFVVAGALALTLVAAAATQASSGVIGYFQFAHESCNQANCPKQSAQDAISEGTAVAVNASGTGGASPGDIYILDGDSDRVHQFSPAGEFIRLWGADVVKSGPGSSNEVQAVRISATGGSFELEFGPDATGDIPTTAPAAQVEATLQGLSSIGAGGVSVTGGPGDAGGTTPYVVTFDGGSRAGKDQPQLRVSEGSTPLSGGSATATAYTARQGGSGFEVCQPADGDECGASNESSTEAPGGNLTNPSDMVLDQVTGRLFVANANRIEEYSGTGEFIRAWGSDVVASGPGDSAGPDEQKSLTVNATGGTFTLGYQRAPNASTQSTAPLPYNASAPAVQAALNGLAELGGSYSSVTVTGGPGDLTGSNPYQITFHGLLGGDDLGDVLVSNPNSLTITSGSKSAAIGTVTDGGGYEICEPNDTCKSGSAEGPLAIISGAASLDVAPPGTPNAGHVLISDGLSDRVLEFTAEGDFVRSFGWNVDATEPSTEFEVCTAASGDVCQAGTSGAGVGQLSFAAGVTEDSTGAIYTVEDTGGRQAQYAGVGNRVQKFTPSGGLSLAPSLFGASEVQALTVNAGGGQYRLAFGSEFEGTRATGTLTKGSPVVEVNVSQGVFSVGQPVRTNGGFRDYIVAVGANTITLSKPSPQSSCCGPDVFFSNRIYATPDLSFSASAGEVESALNALPSVSANGGSVTVSGGPGDATGSSPYSIAFNGVLSHSDLAQIAPLGGATPLAGGSGAGANTASVQTTVPGGPGAADGKASPFDIAIGPGDHVFVAKYFPETFTICLDGSPSPSEIRIQELTPEGSVVDTSDRCTGFPGVDGASGRDPNFTVNPITGHPYLLPDILSNAGSQLLGQRLSVFGPPGLLPILALGSVSNITASGGTISGTVNPSGPGTGYPDTTGMPSATRTTYRVEYKRSSDSGWTAYTPDIPAGNGTSPVAFNIGVAGLAPRTTYELRVVAAKPFTGSVGQTTSFTTLPGGPEIEALSSRDLTASSAVLRALINPQGSATSYHFEYGTTPAYGSSTPETDIGEAQTGQAVEEQIEGLNDAVYHFRVIATNPSGTTISGDQTFTFHPPICPNQSVRQQTGAAYLPDCRAYELVSPEDAGGTTLYTGGPQSPYASNPPRLSFVGQLAAIPDSGRNPINTAGDLYVATRGAEGWRTRYVGPSSEEVGCVGGRPLVSGTGYPPTIQNDVMADPGLNRIINWNLGNPVECAFGSFLQIRPRDFNTAARGSNAPYVWNAQGDFLDRWPTSAGDVSGSEDNFSCPQDPNIHPYPSGYFGNIPVSYFCSTYVDASKDLNHFVFSTQSGLFGEGGLTAAPGSAYDNDTAHNTLQLISRLPGGAPIGQEPGAKAGPEELIRFPSVSADGSHILMGTATKPACKQVDFPQGAEDFARRLCPIITQPTHLYMRVDNAVTYDVSAGKPVKYIGSTPDGSRVYFTSDEALTGDDTDTSTDLYMWHEGDGSPALTRISGGSPSPAGNTDECASTWTTNCDVKTYEDSLISTASGNQGGLGSWNPTTTNPGYTDNAIAAQSGDIYFYSPEQLVPGEGAPGKENLYVFHDGAVREVAALEDDPYCITEGDSENKEETCSNGAVGRLQVTPDGHYAAFITTSRITAYDNHGFAEMYRYDAQAEKLQCVSCRPDGSAPIGDVLGSQGGRFITDDGRVFFNTPEPLDPRDTNTGLDVNGQVAGTDVYEFVDGKPQLISSGTGTGSIGRRDRSQPGLYGVSANGADVYFGTTETLVGQDRNAKQLKFYDARTNGGFSFVPPPAPCAAADECRGPGSSAPGPLAGSTGTALGAGGNARNAKPRKHKRRKVHRAKRHGKHASKGKRGNHNAGGAR